MFATEEFFAVPCQGFGGPVACSVHVIVYRKTKGLEGFWHVEYYSRNYSQIGLQGSPYLDLRPAIMVTLFRNL